MRLLKKRKYINFYDTDKIGFSGPYSQMKQVKTATIYLFQVQNRDGIERIFLIEVKLSKYYDNDLLTYARKNLTTC